MRIGKNRLKKKKKKIPKERKRKRGSVVREYEGKSQRKEEKVLEHL